jgi:hypothetical protein
MKVVNFFLLLLSLFSCKTAQKCDAYSIQGYDHIQVLGYTDIVPTFGEGKLNLPPGEYIIKAWKGEEITYIRYEKRTQ